MSELERLIELVMKNDIAFEEALQLIDSLEKEPERFGDAVALLENAGGVRKIV